MEQDVRRAAGTTGAPVAGWASGPLGAVQAADREIARQTAVRARAVAEFAASRPASVDRQPGQPGAMSAERRAARPQVLADVSEWAAQELAVALAISTTAAERLMERSLTLVHRLPGTLVALETGVLHAGHLWPVLERLAPVTGDRERAELERAVLAWVAGRAGKRQLTTPAQLAAKLRRMGLERDSREDATELLAALKERGVWARPDRRPGMAVVTALLTQPEAQAVVDVLGRYADAAADESDADAHADAAVGGRRTRGERMADVLLDLVLRPGEHRLPPVQAQLTVVAGVRAALGGAQAGEIGGEPVPAEMVRALARGLGLLPSPPDEAPDQPPDEPPDEAPDEPPPTVAVGPSGLWPWEVETSPPDTWPDWLREADERWWAELETRALAGEWGGEDDPPPEVQQRIWNEEARWAVPLADAADGAAAVLDHALVQEDPRRASAESAPSESAPSESAPSESAPSESAPSESASSGSLPSGSLPSGSLSSESASAGSSAQAPLWPAAHAAVDQASRALLGLDQALGRASAALDRARAADRADERAWRSSAAGRIDAAGSDLDALAQAGAERRAQLAALLDRSADGTLVDRPRIAVVDELTGALLALTDARELRRRATCARPACRRRPARCDHDLTDRPGLGPPPPTDGYRPAADLDRYLRARDPRCRFPGCRRRVPRGGELDHNTPYPHGPTSADNLTGFCTGDHRGKHQAPGWTYHLDQTGTLTVTTPTGLVAATEPPPF